MSLLNVALVAFSVILGLGVMGCGKGASPSVSAKILLVPPDSDAGWTKVPAVSSSLQSAQSAKSANEISFITAPAALVDFSCFAVRVTGSGVAATPLVSSCSVVDSVKFGAEGYNSELFKDGAVVEFEIASGHNRKFDVYGIYPMNEACTSGAGADLLVGGYLLGSTTVDLVGETVVRIPISFTVADSATISCSYDSIGPTTGAPSSFSYLHQVPVYTLGSAIVANLPSSSGGPVLSYTVYPALPTGLVLDPLTGAITGTPTVISPTASYTITATNNAGSAIQVLAITVNDVAPAALTYGSPNPTYTVGVPISDNVPVTIGGAVVSYTVNPALPLGLVLNPMTGVISGTPTDGAILATYKVTAINSGGSTTKDLMIAVFVNYGCGVDCNADCRMWLLGGDGGYDPNTQSTTKNTIWSSSNGVDWTQHAQLLTEARSRGAAIVYANKIWYLGGTSISAGVTAFHANVWMSSNGVDWTPYSHILKGNRVAFQSAAVFQDKMWLLGGADSDSPSGVRDTAWSLTDGNDWSVGTLGYSVGKHTVGVINGKLWIFGGHGNASIMNYISSSSNGMDWLTNSTNFLPSSLVDASIASLSGSIYIAGGTNTVTDPLKSVITSSDGEKWDSAGGDLPAPRVMGSMVSFKNKLWYVGGWNADATPSLTQTVFVGTPGPTGVTWTSLGDKLPFARAGAALVTYSPSCHTGGQ